jgi:hypothetical protein
VADMDALTSPPPHTEISGGHIAQGDAALVGVDELYDVVLEGKQKGERVEGKVVNGRGGGVYLCGQSCEAGKDNGTNEEDPIKQSCFKRWTQPCSPHGLKAENGRVLHGYLAARGLVAASTFAKPQQGKMHHLTWASQCTLAQHQTDYMIVAGVEFKRVADCGMAGSTNRYSASGDHAKRHIMIQCTLTIAYALKRGIERCSLREKQMFARRQQERTQKRGVCSRRKPCPAEKRATSVTSVATPGGGCGAAASSRVRGRAGSSSDECGPPLVMSLLHHGECSSGVSVGSSGEPGWGTVELTAVQPAWYGASYPFHGLNRKNHSLCTQCSRAAKYSDLHIDLLDSQRYCECCFERFYGVGWRAHAEVDHGGTMSTTVPSVAAAAAAPATATGFGEVVMSASGAASNMNVTAQAWIPAMSTEVSALAGLGPGAVGRERNNARARRLAARSAQRPTKQQ